MTCIHEKEEGRRMKEGRKEERKKGRMRERKKGK